MPAYLMTRNTSWKAWARAARPRIAKVSQTTSPKATPVLKATAPLVPRPRTRATMAAMPGPGDAAAMKSGVEKSEKASDIHGNSPARSRLGIIVARAPTNWLVSVPLAPAYTCNTSARPSKSANRLRIGARHPDLAAQGLQRVEKAGPAPGIEMGRDLVEQNERRDAASCCRRAERGRGRGR